MVWGDGTVIRDYIHVSDVARAFQLIAKSGLKNQIVNIGSGQGYSVNQIIEMLRGISGKEFAVRYQDSRPYDVPINVLDIGKAKRDYGWKPEIDLLTGLRSTYEWVQQSAGIESAWS